MSMEFWLYEYDLYFSYVRKAKMHMHGQNYWLSYALIYMWIIFGIHTYLETSIVMAHALQASF